MKFFVIGSYVTEESTKEEFSHYCQLLGVKLYQHRITLIICSPFESSCDYHFLKGISTLGKYNSQLEIHFPKLINVKEEWNKTLSILFPGNEPKVNKFPHAPISQDGKADLTQSWLFSQLQALNNADLVITIGGNPSGVSNLLLRVAEANGKFIVPIKKFGGSGYVFFERNQWQLDDRLSREQYTALEKGDDIDEIVQLIINFPNLVEERANNLNINPLFFLSYARARPAEADYIEMILRRRNFTVLRDEEEFGADQDIPNMIKESIYRANVFIAVWCKEYACSPWCFDELSLALKRKKSKNLELWIICVDDTRMIHPEARKILNHPVSTRSEMGGRQTARTRKIFNKMFVIFNHKTQ